MLNKKRNIWAIYIVILFIILQIGALYILKDHIYIQIFDNLDSNIAIFQMLKNSSTFFSNMKEVPLLGGIDRDLLVSDLLVYNLFYYLLPTFWAYVVTYFLRILIAVAGIWFLCKEYERTAGYELNNNLIIMTGFLYGICPYYPTCGFAFASIPFLLYFLMKYGKKTEKKYAAALFFYPAFSEISTFGIFFILFLGIFFILKTVRDKKLAMGVLKAIILLGAGYVLFNYRMVFSALKSVESIRNQFLFAPVGLRNSLSLAKKYFLYGDDYSVSVIQKPVLLAAAVYFVIVVIEYILKKKFDRKVIYLGLGIACIGFMSCIGALAQWTPIKAFLTEYIPVIGSLQFNRIVWFSPFLWYIELLAIAYCFSQKGKRGKAAALMLIFVCLTANLCDTSKFNDFSNTMRYTAKALEGEETTFTYHEFYSEDLFAQIKKDIGYNGEWAAAYGFYPAVLEYNGIATLDGYYSNYSLDYKDKWRKVIRPELEISETDREYYENWGGRAYLFDVNAEHLYLQHTKELQYEDSNLYMDTDAYKELGGKYIFSRIEVANAVDLKLELVGVYSNDAYDIYVYRL